MKIVVVFDEEKIENVTVKTGKYMLYQKMKKFVDKFEKLLNEYTENITPEIVEYAPDDIDELEKVIDKEMEVQNTFYELVDKINNVCFETVERAYN